MSRLQASRSVAIGLAMSVVMTVGCASVRSGFGPGVNYTEWGESFGWIPPEHSPTAAQKLENATFDTYVREVITTAFAARGYAHVESAPAFWIDYQVTRGRAYTEEARWTGPYLRGHLVIDVINPQTQKIVWRGQSRLYIDVNDRPTVRREKVARTVEEILKRFPTLGNQ
jgi:hypothetical protein